MDGAKLVMVESFATSPGAEMAKSVLSSAGIDSFIQSDSEGGVGPHLAFTTGGYKLLVREEDAETAHERLQGPDDES